MGILMGKIAVVTGSTRGLGKAIARRYAEEGASVVLSSRTVSAVDEAVAAFQADGLQAAGQACDVSDQTQVMALADYAVETFGKIDIWVNNAALSGPYGPTIHLLPEAFLKVVQANIMGTYYGSRAALLHMIPRGEGKLINLLGRGYKGPAPNQNAYGSSKVWVLNFTKALAKEYKDSGVGIHAFSPGLVETDLLYRPTVVEGYEARMNPLKTVIKLWANPPEVPAEKALWLASPETDGKTGLQVEVLGRPQIFGGLLREGLRRLTGRSGPPVKLDITTVPSEFQG
jgi:glucose 1-dehydrogenase